jgi:hypothetical protein
MSNVLESLAALPADQRAAVMASLADHGEEYGVHPSSPAQRRLWLLDQLFPGSPAYHVPVAFRITGALDAAALGEALRDLGRRHESLRTAFLAVDGEPRQVILPEPQFELAVRDQPGLDAATRSALAALQARHDALAPFALQTGPLLRATLLRFDDRDAALSLCLHHIVCDGWSMRILLEELSQAYARRIEGAGSGLPEAELQYLDYARRQGQWLAGPDGARAREYWTRELAGAPAVLEMPTDHPRPAVRAMRGAQQHFTWPADLASALATFCRQEAVTPFMALLAAYALLLSRHSGQDEVVIGTAAANRAQPEAAGVVGLLVNTLALRVPVRSTESFVELVRRVRDIVLRATEHQEYPFDAVVDALDVHRGTAHQPVVQTMLVMRDSPTDALVLPGTRVHARTLHNGAAKFDFQLDVTVRADGVSGCLEYDAELFRAQTMDLLAQRLRVLAAAALAQPGRPVATLPLLADGEREPGDRHPLPAGAGAVLPRNGVTAFHPHVRAT